MLHHLPVITVTPACHVEAIIPESAVTEIRTDLQYKSNPASLQLLTIDSDNVYRQRILTIQHDKVYRQLYDDGRLLQQKLTS